MSVWFKVFSKDIRMLRTGWLALLGISIIICGAAGAASYFHWVNPGMATAVGIVVIVANVFVFPSQLFKGLNKEMKGSPSLWLRTPLSGWAMLGSKCAVGLVIAVVFLAVSYGLSLFLFHFDLAHALPNPELHSQIPSAGNGLSFSWGANTPTQLAPPQFTLRNLVLNELPLIVIYMAISLGAIGIYIGLWVSFIYTSVRAVRNRLRKWSWLVGLGLVLIATWGLGAVKASGFYHHLFGWGHIPFTALIPVTLPANTAVELGNSITTLDMGSLVFYVMITVILFFLTGLLIDRHVEA